VGVWFVCVYVVCVCVCVGKSWYHLLKILDSFHYTDQ